ncbi:MAG TPA: hypothetical protein VKB34_12900 [Povalibacter sp.]|nr:hypothetical protein [Povalibacter sp.]
MSHEALEGSRGIGRYAQGAARVLAMSCILLVSARAVAQTPAADLLITVSDARNSYVAGAEVTYTVTVTNRGTEAVRGVTIEGPLPNGVTTARWTCSAATGATCGTTSGTGALSDTPDLGAGTTVTYFVTLAIPANYASQSLAYQVGAKLPQGYAATVPGNLTATDTDSPPPTGNPAAGAGIIAPRTDSRVGTVSPQPRLLGAAPHAPFTCSTDMFISQGKDNDTRTTLYRVDTTVNPFVLTPLGTNQNDFAYNALGYNPADNFLYAIRVRRTGLYRVHSDGTTEGVGQVAGLPALDSSNPGDTYNAGDFGTDGYMYVKRQGSVNTIYRIDIAALTARAIPLINGPVDGADMAWIPDQADPTRGVLYTLNTNGILARIDPTTGQVTRLPVNNGPLFQGNANVGALFGSASGLFGGRNSPPEYYQLNLTTGLATKVSLGDRVVNVNDGAHCASAPVDLYADLSVTKTNTPQSGPNDLPDDTYAPGTDVTYTIVVSNAGPSDVHDALVQDPLPAGITSARWTCTVTGAGSCGAPSGTGAINDPLDLTSGGKATYLFTVTVPSNHAQTHTTLSNTVTAVLPDGFTDPTPNDLTANDTDTPSADLRVVKTTPSQSALVGETLTYTITVSNPGTADVVNAVLRDTADARLDCPGVSATAACTAQNGSVCPAATVPVSALLGAGITIPSLPARSSMLFTLSCRVLP